eukprot:TRINITY_DN22965_c0_g1_i1.p1 TRINITY_DN22965_c0_g1~~TRINITY_DN22965_c0_g1_i1.p1  ORF type:complete len:225 (+),score=38.86 TRINITY_DN22965_c0_g1_i1:46-675(+)
MVRQGKQQLQKYPGGSSEVVALDMAGDSYNDEAEEERKAFKQKLVRSLVFGAVDGMGTTITLVWGAAPLGDAVGDDALLSLGVGNLLAKGVSMGIGDYLGSQAENKITGNSNTHSFRSGIVMFSSFVIFGGLPLFALLPAAPLQSRHQFLCAFCAISLFSLGIVKSRLTSTPAWSSGLLMMSAGGAAAAASYIIGHAVHSLLGVPDEVG